MRSLLNAIKLIPVIGILLLYCAVRPAKERK